jgi:hypothetical protein
VFVIENGVVRQQNVTVGAQEGSHYEILSGLEGDELLAASNLNQIVTGTKVSTGSGREDGAQRGPRRQSTEQGGTE